MLEKFIERPVLSTVISIVIVILGLVSLVSLPIQQYPDIAPPTVVVNANYPGANSDVVMNSVIAPLEEQINGVEGMTYMVSSARNDGMAEIYIYFSLDTDPDQAAVNVQNRVAAASSSLPAVVNSMGVTTKKQQNGMLMVVSLSSDNADHDETFIQNYARNYLLPAFQRIKGVGNVQVFGAKNYAMRVWLDPDLMNSHKVTPAEVQAAISEQSCEVAPGKFGTNSDKAFQYTIKYKGRLSKPEEFENIILRVSENGEILRLKDVAKIEFGAQNYDVVAYADGKPGVVMAINQMKGSNSQEICTEVKRQLKEMQSSFPEGIKYELVMDSQAFLDASIHEVVKTLIEAFILVFIVVLVFLQNVKSTVIPAISALVAIIGTFIFLKLFGFTINLLTLFALVLSIGIVVDDAIVVVEAVYAKLEKSSDISTLDATKGAMREITGAVLSITLVFLATFLPASFMSGASGVFYQQFCTTLAVSVVISAVNALTLSPALCVIFIKREAEGEKKSLLQRFGIAFNAAFGKLTDKYVGVLSKLAKRKVITMLVFVGFLVAAVFLMKITPTAFVPTEDQGVVYYDVMMPEGTTTERTEAVLKEVDSLLAQIPEIQTRVDVAGTGLISGAYGGSYGMGIIQLVPWEERDTTSILEIYQRMVASVKDVSRDANIIFFLPPTILGYGASDGIEMQLLDQTGSDDLSKLYEQGNRLVAALQEHPEVGFASSSFTVNFPQYEMVVDVNKCKMMGVSVADVFSAIQTYYGGAVSGDFTRFTKFYRVMVQAIPNSRGDVESLGRMTVKNNQGDMVPMNTLVSMKRVFGSELIKRYNMFPTSTITVTAGNGASSGEVMALIDKVAKETLDNGFKYEYSGMTRDEVESGGQQGIVFGLSFILVYLILSALYESYILPLSVILSLLLGVFGVYTSVNIVGLPANIYVQIALIMLLGLLAKNAILIVEFAKQRREAGEDLTKAALDAAHDRLRPILMTSFAFIFGMLPLCLSSGAGAAGNFSIGLSAAGGFLISTILALMFVPIMFIIFQGLQEKVRKNK